MQTSLPPAAYNLSTEYAPVAIYFAGSDTLEYVRIDAPSVYRRIDDFLTLIFDMKSREQLIGFQLKGFKSFYLQDAGHTQLGDDFLSLVGLLERAMTRFGAGVFEAAEKEAYARARRLALEDKVELRDLPQVA